MLNPVVAVFRLLGFALWTLALMGPYLLLLAVGWRGYIAYVRFYWRVVRRICGIAVAVTGRPAAEGPVLFVSNHASYLDIMVLGSLLEANFVAKSEVAGWPGFGFLSRIARTVFVDRKRGGTAKERDSLLSRLTQGDSLILFPEGTSNDGNTVLPFKSSLFAVAQLPVDQGQGGRRPLPVQPVSVAYTRLDGLPMGRAFRPFYAWYGDMTMAGHLLQALALGQVTVEVEFHPVVTIDDFADRKALAHHCHDVVRRAVIESLCGRRHRPLPPRAGPTRATPSEPAPASPSP